MLAEARYNPVLLPLLRKAHKIVVIPHLNPDGDAVAALLALTSSLRLARWEARAVSSSQIPASYRFLPGWETVAVYSREDSDRSGESEARRALQEAELIVSLDCSDLTRLGALYEDHVGKFESTPIVNIDHHATNTNFGRLNLVDTTAASVCEYLAALMELEDLPMTGEIATALLTGIVADTLGFRTASTSPGTLRIAATLMERGATLSKISEFVFNTRSARTLCLWGHVLSHTQIEYGLVWAEITRGMLGECGAQMEDADTLVDFIAGVPGTSGAILFSEQEDGSVRASVRTSGELDAAALTGVFGGGGHTRAAGCTLEGPIARARAVLLAEARLRIERVAGRRGEER